MNDDSPHNEIDRLLSLDEQTFNDTVSVALDRLQKWYMEEWPLQETVKAAAYLLGIDGLDGEYNPQTQELVERFGAKGVAMTPMWAIAPPGWACPGCGRTKPELVRLDKNNLLMCKLVEHHDHMDQTLLDLFHELSSSRETVVADDVAEAFAKRLSPAVSAFDRVVVCQDCNNIDVTAKRAVDAPSAFSFSASEIRQFVDATPNRPHELDENAASQVWEDIRSTFELRIKTARELAEIAASNVHWYQQSHVEWNPDHLLQKAKVSASTQWKIKHFTPDMLFKTLTKSGRSAAAWRQEVHPACATPPTKSEISHVVQVVAQKVWTNVPDTWRCPGCGRTKVEAIRPTKQFKWNLVIRSRRFSKSDGGGEEIIICGDCYMVTSDLGKEMGKSGRETAALVDVRRIVLSQPHGRHNIDHSAVDKLLTGKGYRLYLGKCR